MERDKRVKYLLLIIGLTFTIYANTLKNDFVSDDLPAIVTNPNISCISCVSDLVNLSYHLNYLIGKLDPFIYHLTNIILHLLNSILVFFFLSLFFKATPSFWGSLIFVSHPIHTEAVTWIAGRPYLIFTCLLLFSFLSYVRATSYNNSKSKLSDGSGCFSRPIILNERKRVKDLDRSFVPFATLRGLRMSSRKDKESSPTAQLSINYFLISLLMYFLSLYSGIFALIFPGMLILYDFTFGRWRKNYKLWFAFFALTLLKLLLISGGIKQRVIQVGLDTGQPGMSNPILNMAFSVFTHLSLLIWPQKLTLYHEPNIISAAALGFEIFLLVLLFLLLPWIFKKTRKIFFAICFFILFLLPTYSPVAISWLVAERYLYFPSLALSMLAAFWIDRYAKEGKLKKWVSILLISLIVLYSWRTVVRNSDWKTHASIWKATVEVSPKSPKAHNNMGDVYSLEGNLEKAAEEFSRAIELKPDYADAYHNLASVYQKMGRIDEAIMNYKKAVSINPFLYQSYQNLGVIYLNKHQVDLAKEYFSKVLEIAPDNASVRQILRESENINDNK